GMLTRADINTTDYGNWTLLDPVETAVSPSAVELETLCLQNQHRTRLCAKVSQLADHWNIDISARDFVLATIKPWLPPELVVDGLADANAELQFHSSPRLSGKVKISLQPGSVEYNLVSNPVKNLRYVVGELTVDAGPSGINTSAKMTLDNGDEIDGSFQFTGADPLNFNLQSQKIAGKANVKLQDLTLIDTLVEQINSLEGQADVQLEVSGILGKPQIQARARLDNIGFGIVGTPLKFTQLSARLESPLLEKVSYQVEATVAEGRLRLNGNTRLNPEAGWPSDIEVDGDQLVIKELIWPWLPPGLAVEGVMQSSAKLTFNTADKLRGVVQLEASSGSLTYSLIEDGPDNWEFKNARITLDLNAQGISADAGFIISDNVARATLSLPGATLPGLDLETQTIVASADLDFKDLSMLEALVSEIQKTQGRLLVKLGVDGTLANPGYRAKVDLIEASVNIPRVGLALKNISLNATTNDTNELVFKGKVESGNGKISINGNSLLDPAKSWPTTISITGDRFEVARMPEATVQVSPDLKINITGTKINLSGEIIVPYAKLQPRDITTAAKVSSDTVILGADQPVEQKWVITSRVNLILGESVNFFGYGFEGKLGGRIIIEEQPGQPTRGIGEITILEGRYRAYGQRLDITNGRLLFSGGPITNPGLDLRATRTGRDNVIAGLNVRGRLQQPKVDLFSIPSLGQTDTLSYLLTGGPISSASGDEGAMMANAALALGLSGGDNIARSIGDKFGFDVMRVETNNTGDQASLVVGRYLTPRLYVSYGAGIIESINTLNLRYQISERWTLESENGEHQGADLLFSFEP
ncbi:MAG: autotransporter translocation and assembly factor TamB, partial [Planctomycetota bacterium]